jgi:hypothetical protein
VARLFGSRRVRFYENGVTSLHVPIAANVLGSRATRTTHPRMLKGLSALFSALLAGPVFVENPFIWRTKRDVVHSIAENNCAQFIKHAVSCTRVRQRTTMHPHCGVCSQCIERRFAILSAGLEVHDPAEMYEVDLLVGERERGDERTMAEAYVRTATRIEQMTEAAFFESFGELFRAVNYLDEPSAAAGRKLLDLHKRHAANVCEVIDRAIGEHASALRLDQLPESCLVRLALPRAGKAAREQSLARAARGTERPDIQTELRIAFDSARRQVLLDNAAALKGASYELLNALRPCYERAQRDGLLPEAYPYTSAGKLAEALNLDQPTLRKRLDRLRKALAAFGFGPDELIENLPWRGYRISPQVRIVAAVHLSPTGVTPAQTERHNSTKFGRKIKA